MSVHFIDFVVVLFHLAGLVGFHIHIFVSSSQDLKILQIPKEWNHALGSLENMIQFVVMGYKVIVHMFYNQEGLVQNIQLHDSFLLSQENIEIQAICLCLVICLLSQTPVISIFSYSLRINKNHCPPAIPRFLFEASSNWRLHLFDFCIHSTRPS